MLSLKSRKISSLSCWKKPATAPKKKNKWSSNFKKSNQMSIPPSLLYQVQQHVKDDLIL